jgi:hypothetical protein
MARELVGKVLKGKDRDDGTKAPPYIKIEKDFSLKKGDFLNLESKAEQLKSLNFAVSKDKISADLGEKIKERIEKIPDFVLFEIIKVSK